MIYALLIGRKGSKGFPNKNTHPIFNKKLCEYPLIASKKSNYINKIFVSTDCPKISKISLNYGATLIKRPKYLSTDKALGEDVFEHGYKIIKKITNKNDKEIELLVLLFANSATVDHKLIDSGIEFLRRNKKFDSAVSTSIYNMWSPLRARKLSADGSLKPFIPFKNFSKKKNLNCDRNSQGNVYFADMSVSIVRPKCLLNIKNGLLPQKWMGKKIAPIFSNFGCDVDYEWQIPIVKYWIKKNLKKIK